MRFFRNCATVNASGPPKRLMASQELSLWCTAQFYDVDCNNGLQAKKGKDNLWKTCIWKRNSDGATCTIEAKDEWTTKIEQCDSSLGQVNIIGGNRMECRINIPHVEMKDLGNWTCKMEKCNDEEKGGCGHKDSGDCSEEDTFFVAVHYHLSIYIWCFSQYNYNKHISINIYVRITNPSMVTGCAQGNYDARTQSRSS